MAGIFGTTDYSKTTQRYNDGSYFDIVLGDGVTAIGKEYRANTAIRSIVIPSSVTAWPTGTIEVLGNNVFPSL